MVANKSASGQKYYTVAEANATLPLVRAIVRDITELARELDERHERIRRASASEGKTRPSDAHQEELDHITAELERGHSRMQELVQELNGLGVELKDHRTGLLDFRCWMGNREVYLCWREGEPEVGHWHELDAGFAGRQKIKGDGRLTGAELRTKTSDL